MSLTFLASLGAGLAVDFRLRPVRGFLELSPFDGFTVCSTSYKYSKPCFIHFDRFCLFVLMLYVLVNNFSVNVRVILDLVLSSG